ncbi:hypothetical protein [Yeosuana sp.]|uniref:hypothetical protein n=1 Tax=Yeosuana sp. TaxID=2529388 RepID=UPI004054C9EE
MVGVYDEAICLLCVPYYEIATLHKVTLAMNEACKSDSSGILFKNYGKAIWYADYN